MLCSSPALLYPLHLPPLLCPLLGLFILLFFVPFLASSSSSSSYSSSSSSFSTSNLNTYLVSLLDVFLAPPLSPGHYYRASLLLPLFSLWLRLTPGWLWPSTATLRSHLNAHRAPKWQTRRLVLCAMTTVSWNITNYIRGVKMCVFLFVITDSPHLPAPVCIIWRLSSPALSPLTLTLITPSPNQS